MYLIANPKSAQC